MAAAAAQQLQEVVLSAAPPRAQLRASRLVRSARRVEVNVAKGLGEAQAGLFGIWDSFENLFPIKLDL